MVNLKKTSAFIKNRQQVALDYVVLCPSTVFLYSISFILIEYKGERLKVPKFFQSFCCTELYRSESSGVGVSLWIQLWKSNLSKIVLAVF